MLAEQCATLAFGHSSPDSEFDAVVEGVGPAFELNRAVPADGGGFALGCSADEQLVRVRPPAFGLGNPRKPSLCFSGRHCRWRHP